MKDRRRTRVYCTLVITGLLVIAASEVVAVPTFARRYSTSCATCHQAYPRLNSVGESFRLMGYRFVDDENYRKQQPVELGDEAYKRLWPKALWPSEIPRNSPLSFIGRFMVEADLDGTRPSTFTFLLPEELELVWAGNLGEKISFYGDAIFLQKDFGGADPDSWLTLKAWLQFQSLFGGDNKFNLRLGTVGTQTMALFNARDANFYGTHFYLYTSWFMPPVNLAAGRAGELQRQQLLHRPADGCRAQRRRQTVVLRRRGGQRKPRCPGGDAAAERRQLRRAGLREQRQGLLHPARLQDRRHRRGTAATSRPERP